jgi:hypothetical protein
MDDRAVARSANSGTNRLVHHVLVDAAMPNSLTKLVIALAIAACGDVKTPPEPDAAIAPDAPPNATPVPGRDIATATGRMTGGTWTADIHLGAVTNHTPIGGNGWSAQTTSPIHP